MVYRLTQLPVLNALGDSHNEVFRELARCRLLGRQRVRCTTVQGATVFGLANANSKTNALKIFSREISAIPQSQCLSLLLGEDDCGSLVWVRAETYSTTVEEQIKDSLARYRSLMQSIASRGFRQVLVLSVPPPTISDGFNQGLVASQRGQVTATMKDRTDFTRRYNAGLRVLADEFGFVFVDIFERLIDPTTGVVRDELRHTNPLDHHLDPAKLAVILVDALANWVCPRVLRM